MGKGLPRSHSRGVPLSKEIIKQLVTLDEVAVSVAGTSGVGWGTAVIGGLPEGNLLFLGAVGYMTISGPGSSGDLDDAWLGDYGVGTTPADDGTITTGDVDIIQSTGTTAATAEVSPRTRGTSLGADTGEVHDNTDGSLELNLNVLVDNDKIGGTVAMTVTGVLELSYIMLLDD